jgi:hypothetical protein
MAYCANCGSPLNEGQRFCPSCGHQAGEQAPAGAGNVPGAPGGAQPAQYAPQQGWAAPQQPPQQAPQQPYQPPQQPGYQQPGYPPGWTYYQQQGPAGVPPRRSRTGLWIGLAAAVVLIAVACVLVFVVFWGDIAGGGAASNPEKTVRNFLSAFDNKDVDAVFDLLDPESMSDMLGDQSVEDAKADMRDALFADAGISSIKFSGMQMTTKETGNKATVTLTAGKAIITDENGNQETSDVKEADSPPTIDLVKRDGSWYIDPGSMNFLGGGGDEFGGDVTTTDTTDQGPPTTAGGSTSTTFTTTTGLSGGSGAKTPQEVVMKFFDAMKNKDMAAVFALFDPVALEEITQGVSLDYFMGMMGESLFDYESVEFSGIEVDVEFQDDANATVTVVAGTATITDTDGYTTTEDVTEADEPVGFTVIQRDGSWYLDPSMFEEGL